MSARSETVLLPWAVAATGRLIHITDAIHGKSCDCTCPGCGAPVVARQGPQLAWCFAHTSGAECVGALESAAHRRAKEIIAERMELHLPGYDYDGKPIIRAVTVQADRTETERAIGPIRPDLLFWSGHRRLAVEIFVKHRSDDPQKLATFRAFDQPAVEIDVRGADLTDPDAFAQAVVHDAPRRWLFHPRIDIDVSREELKREREALQRERDAMAEEMKRERERLDELEKRRSNQAELALAWHAEQRLAFAERDQHIEEHANNLLREKREALQGWELDIASRERGLAQREHKVERQEQDWAERKQILDALNAKRSSVDKEAAEQEAMRRALATAKVDIERGACRTIRSLPAHLEDIRDLA